MTNLLTFKQKYKIIGSKTSKYEGLFITCVKTTGIFCRPSCRARKPNVENVDFVENVNQALQHGYRPCKLCKPMTKLEETPEYIQQLINDLNNNPYLRIKDADLKIRQLEPNHIRRWFKKHHNMTFQSYQRMLRINAAYVSITKGESITNSAFDNGFESLSGFNNSYKSIFGDSASQPNSKSIINIVRLTTPIGPMFACATDLGVCLLDFSDRKILEKEFIELTSRLDAVILPGNNRHLKKLKHQLEEYFTGKRKSFSVPLHHPSTDFREAVWKELQSIPYGQTRSYKQQAIALGNPKAVRAVAGANSQNRINILIPCHRVIGSDGKLTGYGGGLPRKKWLLDFEKNRS